MPGLSQRLFAMLDLREGEARPVGLLFALAALLGFARLLFYATANGLFLSVFDAATLPLVYIAIAVVTVGTGLLYSALQKRLPFAWLLRIGVGFLAVSVLLLRAGVGLSHARWIVFLLPTWFMAMLILGLLVLWGAAGRMFDVRQARRLFGLIGAGEVLGDIAGGLAVSPLAAWWGTTNVLFASAAGFVLALAPLSALALPSATAATTAATRTEPKPTRNVFRQRYVLSLALMSALMNVSYYFLDLGFLRQVQGLPSADAAATFIGRLFAVTGVVDLVGRVLIAGRVLDRFGPTVGVLALPVGLTVWMGGIVGVALVSGNALFWPVALTMPLWTLLRNWLDKPGSLLLYQPLPPDQRTAAQLAVELICDPVAIGVAGVALLLLAKLPSLGAGGLALLSTGLAVAWLVIALRLRREYVRILEDAISKRRLSEETLASGGPAHVAIVRRGLDSKHEGEVVYSLSLLASIDPSLLPGVLPRLLSHSSAEVRLHVLGLIERLGVVAAAPMVRERIEWDPSRDVQAAALRALAALGEDDAVDLLRAQLVASDPPMKTAALVGLIGHGGLEGMLAAAPTLQQLVTSPSADDRVLAANVFASVASPGLYRPVLALLEDGDARVQAAALVSAGRIASPRLLTAIVPKLASGKTSAQAAGALSVAGEAALPQLATALADATIGPKTRTQAIRVLGKLGTPRASQLLWTQLHHPDVIARARALEALARCGFRPDAAQAAELRTLLDQELEIAIEDTAALCDLPEDDDVLAVVRDALSLSLEHTRSRIFSILGFVVASPRAVRDAQIGLASASPALRANSLEVLELLLTHDARRVMPIVSALPPIEAIERLLPDHAPRDADAHLRTLLARSRAHAAPWTLVAAAWAAGQRKPADVPARLSNDDDPWIRETALWAADDPKARTTRKPAMLTIEKVMILKRTALFSQAPNDVLAEVAGVLERVEVQAGEQIIAEGERGTSMFIIVDGEARVHSGKKEIARLKAPTVFGELAALDPEPRLASVTAVTDLLLLRLDNETLEAAIAEEPAVARAVIRHLCKTFRGVQTAASASKPRSLRETLSGLPGDYKVP